MHTGYRERYLAEAGIPSAPARGAVSSLTRLADDALRLAGIPEAGLARIDAALAADLGPGESDSIPPLADVLGAGAAAATILGMGATLDHAFKEGLEIADFIWDKRDLFRAGWAAVAPAVETELYARIIGVPGDAFEIAEKIRAFYEHFQLAEQMLALAPDQIVEVAGRVQYAVDAGITSLASAAVDGYELFENVATLGTTLAAGWVMAKAVDKYYEGDLKALGARYEAARRKCQELYMLRTVLRSRLPAVTVAAQLEALEPKHLGF